MFCPDAPFRRERMARICAVLCRRFSLFEAKFKYHLYFKIKQLLLVPDFPHLFAAAAPLLSPVTIQNRVPMRLTPITTLSMPSRIRYAPENQRRVVRVSMGLNSMSMPRISPAMFSSRVTQ